MVANSDQMTISSNYMEHATMIVKRDLWQYTVAEDVVIVGRVVTVTVVFLQCKVQCQ